MPPRPDKKQRLSVYLDPDLKRRLGDFAGSEGNRIPSSQRLPSRRFSHRTRMSGRKPQSANVSTGLIAASSGERDVGIANEAFALFIRFWLNSTASVPEAAQAAARAKGGERYDKFLEALGRRLASGPRLRQEVPEERS